MSEKATNFRVRDEMPHYDVTTVFGKDKEGNEKLTFTIEKDNEFLATEVQEIRQKIKEVLAKRNNEV